MLTKDEYDNARRCGSLVEITIYGYSDSVEYLRAPGCGILVSGAAAECLKMIEHLEVMGGVFPHKSDIAALATPKG